jgi:hypothetical protein
MMDIFDTIFSHLVVDHISRSIDKKEAAKAAEAAKAPAATVGEYRRARLRREVLRRLVEES